MTTILLPKWLQNAQFVLSAAQSSQFPEDVGGEIAFIGRSNVGKSSVLNAVANRRQLAKTSKTPGRTQLINFFQCESALRLVDLPGYGFAKVSQSMRMHWDKTISYYLEHRQSLLGLVLIMDVRHPLKETDWQIIHWVRSANLPLILLLNKADKLSRSQQQTCLQQVLAKLEKAQDIEVLLFSAEKKMNLAGLYEKLNAWVSECSGEC